MEIIENRDAQFMLLAGFIIGIGLVITTVMLNSVIFEGNVALGSGNEPSKTEIVNLMQITKDETRAAYRNVTSGSTSNNSRIIANFTNQTQNFRDNLSTIYALNGEGVNLSWNISNWNNSNYAYFTDNGSANGAANWTMVESVKNSTIKINITLYTVPFYINITNATKTWQINFTSQGSRIINNTDIRANITSAYNITFINGANVAGNYSIDGNTTYGRDFIRDRDYILYANVSYSTSRVRADITIPASVPW